MGRFTLRPYDPADAEAWDACVERSINGTLFHRRRFLAYHPPGRFDDSSLLFSKGDRLVAVFPAARVLEKGVAVLRSHPGASYGGLVVVQPPGLADASAMLELLLAWAAEAGMERIVLRTPPRIFAATPCDEIEFALRICGFRAEQCELSTCYDLSALAGTPNADADAALATFKSSCARAVRKARSSGLVTRWCERDADFLSYHAMLAATLARHGARPTHSADELLQLRAAFPDDVRLLGVFAGPELVAGIVAFVCNARAAHVFYFASSPEHQSERPLNLAVLELIRWARERGLRFVNFGISTEAGGTVVNWGLYRFKESFGGGGTLRTLWVKEIQS